MAFSSIINSMLDPIFYPLLKLGPLWAILIISFAVSLLITVVYKFVTDQNLMKQLKDEMKALQKEMKELKNEPQKAMEVQKKAMDRNFKYMGHSLKPTLITFIPIIIIFGWLNGHMGYHPIMPGQEFTTILTTQEGITATITLDAPGMAVLSDNPKELLDGKARWTLKADEPGEYTILYEVSGKTYTKEVIIKKENGYAPPVTKIKDTLVKEIEVEHEKLIVMDLFGWKLGWLGMYIIFSLIFSIALRKVLNVY